jgi:hypothetical protein
MTVEPIQRQHHRAGNYGSVKRTCLSTPRDYAIPSQTNYTSKSEVLIWRQPPPAVREA